MWACGAELSWGGRACSEPPCGRGAGGFEWERVRWGWGRYLWMCCLSWLRMVRAPPSPPHPQHPLRLLLLPSCVSPTKAGSADTQPPRQRPLWAFRETRAERGAGSIYLFFLKAGGVLRGTPCSCWECLPACPGSVRDEKRRHSADAGAFPGTRTESQYAFPGARSASTALGTTQDLQGVGKSLCVGWLGLVP